MDPKKILDMCTRYAEYIGCYNLKAAPELMVVLDKGMSGEGLSDADLDLIVREIPEAIPVFIAGKDKVPIFSAGRDRIEIRAEVGLCLPANDGERRSIVFYSAGGRCLEAHTGTWGGNGGAFLRNGPGPVDSGDERRPVPVDGRVEKIREGGRLPGKTVVLHPLSAWRILPDLPAKTVISDVEKKTLLTIRGTKSGYRADAFRRQGLGQYSRDNPAITSLLAKGLLSVNKAGAIALTDAGKAFTTATRGY